MEISEERAEKMNKKEGSMEKWEWERSQERQRKFPDTKDSQPPIPCCPSKLKEPSPWWSIFPRILSPCIKGSTRTGI